MTDTHFAAAGGRDQQGRKGDPGPAVNPAWPEYLQAFPPPAGGLRPGCGPRRLLPERPSGRAVVLLHGLTDSPRYLLAIGQLFCHRLGYRVYLPLLAGHGLRRPRGMAGVSLQAWKENVAFALDAAVAAGDRVSIGGLSTGGALALQAACTDPRVAGDIYLFAAALHLFDNGLPLLGRRLGRLIEWLLRQRSFHLLDNRRPLIGTNPYRYARVPLAAAGELCRLIAELDTTLAAYRQDRRLAKRVFAAWSAADRVVSPTALAELAGIVKAGGYRQFVVPKEMALAHAGVVLAEPIYPRAVQGDGSVQDPGEAQNARGAAGPPLEGANPLFAEMVAAISDFADFTDSPIDRKSD